MLQLMFSTDSVNGKKPTRSISCISTEVEFEHRSRIKPVSEEYGHLRQVESSRLDESKQISRNSHVQ